MTRTIQLSKQNLFYDIDAAMHLMGEKLGVDGNVKAADLIKSDTQEYMDRRLMTRWTDAAVAKLKGALARWVAGPGPTSADDAISEASPVYNITLSLSGEFVTSMLKPMADLMHEYVVKESSREWLAKFGVKGADEEELRAIVERIKDMALYRLMPEITHD